MSLRPWRECVRSEVCETRVWSETRGFRFREGDWEGVGVLGREDTDAVADEEEGRLWVWAC